MHVYNRKAPHYQFRPLPLRIFFIIQALLRAKKHSLFPNSPRSFSYTCVYSDVNFSPGGTIALLKNKNIVRAHILLFHSRPRCMARSSREIVGVARGEIFFHSLAYIVVAQQALIGNDWQNICVSVATACQWVNQTQFPGYFPPRL